MFVSDGESFICSSEESDGESFICSSEESDGDSFICSSEESEVQAGLELSCQYCTEKIVRFASTGTT